MGGICVSNVYIQAQEPKYPLGFGMGLASSVGPVNMAYVQRLAFRRENRRRVELAQGKTDDEIRPNYTDQDLFDMGDRSPFFRYTL